MTIDVERQLGEGHVFFLGSRDSDELSLHPRECSVRFKMRVLPHGYAAWAISINPGLDRKGNRSAVTNLVICSRIVGASIDEFSAWPLDVYVLDPHDELVLGHDLNQGDYDILAWGTTYADRDSALAARMSFRSPPDEIP